MKNFIAKQKEIIAILTWLLVVGGLIYFVILSLVDNIKNIKDQIQEDELKQQISSQHVGELSKIKQQYNTLESNTSNIDVMLEKQDAVKLIERLEDIANQVNVEISIKVQENQVAKSQASATNKKDQTSGDLISQLPSSSYLRFNISLSGGYDSIVKFIKTTENFEYYGDIISVDIGPDQEKVSVNGDGVLDPFNKNPKNTQTDNNSQANGKLKGNLDIVFYTK